MLRFFCLIHLIVFTIAAKDSTVVNTSEGVIQGKIVSKHRSQKIIGFYGIPYALPPINDLRFAPPVTDNLETWEGTRNATEYRPACLQTARDITEEAKPFLNLISSSDNELEIDEDCLYLNIFVPYGKPPPSGFATVVWFHPGNFTTGSPAMWNPHTLVYRYRIIVVTFAWRLNIMGFFTTMDGEAPGNFGMMDQQAAMMWIKRNIKAFGGNEDNISLMGYGTGGASVGLHMLNHKSRQYFNKVIIMSANFLSPSVIKDPKEDKSLIDHLAKVTSCRRRPTSELIDCLRHLDGKPLVEMTSNINWRPLLDLNLSNSTMAFLTDLPKNLFERGEFYKVPTLTGFTNMENILAYTSLIDTFTTGNITNENLQQILSEIVNSDIPDNNSTDCSNSEHVTDAVMFFYGPNPTETIKDIDSLREIVAEFTTEKNYAASTYLHATYISKETPTFVYRFDLKPTTTWVTENLPDWVSVPHLYDLIYLWGFPYWQEFDGVKNWETRDKRISEIIMSFWTTFAKTSNPTNGSLYAIRWDQFTTDNPQLLIMDGSFNMNNSVKVNYKAFEFWNDYYPKVLEMASMCCGNMDDHAVNIQISYSLLIFISFFFIIRLI